jgi:hypothetical protein
VAFTVSVRAHRFVKLVHGHATEGTMADGQRRTHGLSLNAHIIVLFEILNDDATSLTRGYSDGAHA